MKTLLATLMTLMGAVQAWSADGPVKNGGFEDGCYPNYPGWRYHSKGAKAKNWDFAGNSGISHASDTTFVPSYPSGSKVVCFLQAPSGGGSAATVTQTVEIPADGYYRLSFQYVGRTKFCGQQLTAYIDDTAVWSTRVNASTWSSAAAVVRLSEGKHTLKFAGTHPSGSLSDECSAIDNVSLVSQTENCSTWAEVKANLEAGSSVKLTQNMNADSEIHATSGDLMFDMNGKTVTRTATTRLFNNYSRMSIRVTDSVGGGRFTAGSSTYPHRGSFALINENATFVIDGNVTIDGFKAGGSVEGEGQGGAFTLNSGSLVINSGTIRNCSANSSGGAVYLSAGTSFTMNGGMITNCTATSGGGVYSKGAFTMNGGTIAGCVASDGGGGVSAVSGTVVLSGGAITENTASYGGGISCNGGKVSMTGGVILRNVASSTSGGGVLVGWGSVFEMTGGEISGNKVTAAQDSWKHSGGGVGVKGGTFKLVNGMIAGNSAPSGGGVFVDYNGAMNMSGGVVSENTCSYWGGGIGVKAKGSFTMSGGEITDNATANTGIGLGGGVHSSGGFTMTDGVIRGNKGYSGAALYLNDDQGKTISGGLVLGSHAIVPGTTSFCGGVFDVAPSPVASGYEAVSVNGYRTIAQAGTAATAGGILTAGRYRFDPLDMKYVRLGIVSQQNFYSAKITTNPDVWQLTARKAIDCATWPEVCSNLSAGNDVRVSRSITVASGAGAATVPAGDPVTLDLGGNAITSKLTTALFDLKTPGAALTVDGSGRIVNGAAGEANHNGGCFNLTAGSLEIAGGTYEGFRVKAGYHGGCVYVGSGASFVLTGGVISNCWAGGAGGAVASAGTTVIAGGLLTRNSAANPGGAVAALGGETRVAGGEFAANGTTAKGDAAPANGAALAAVENAKLTVAGGWYHDNVTAADAQTGTGASVYLKLRAAGSAQILGGLFGENRMGGGDEIRDVLVDRSLGGDAVTVAGGFFCRQDPTTLSRYLASECEGVSVRPDWWVIGLRRTVQIANDRVDEGTFTFDPMGEACYQVEELVSSGSRTLYTPASEGGFATWQMTSVADETLSFEGQCLPAEGPVPTGLHMIRTYLTTADGSETSETNHVAVRFDPQGYYAGQTSLDVCGFFERYGEAYLGIDVCTEDDTEVICREPRQKIGFVPYALHASRAESVKLPSLTVETLTVSNSARIGTLAVSAALSVTQSAVITNGASDIEGKVSKMTIDRLNLVGAGTSLFEPIGGMPLAPAARTGWTPVASSVTGLLRPQDGTVAKTVSCPYDGILFLVCATADAGTLDVKVTRSGDVGQEEIFSKTDLVAADGKGYDLSLPVVRGDRVTVAAAAKGEGSATVAYRYVTFGAPREEK